MEDRLLTTFLTKLLTIIVVPAAFSIYLKDNRMAPIVKKQHFTVDEYMSQMYQLNPNQPEFRQAVQEFCDVVIPYMNQHPKYLNEGLLDRLTEPDRIICFRVTWVDDTGEIQVNRGYRVQFNNAIGPYKGGLRFHPSVNLSILKFLGFEQIFKNALTGLPMGGGKGGSNFDPKGKSQGEVMRFCQAFMLELSKVIGDNTDVPAGDIGVGAREVGYLYGMYKKLTNSHTGVITGKGMSYGGSLIRPEATGYGTVYFAENMLKERGDSMEGKRCTVSGSGNVAQYAVEKILQLGGTVHTLSDSSGYIYDEEGITQEKLEYVKELKEVRRGRISEYAEEFGAVFFPGERPWKVPTNCAFPCATQNEISAGDAKILVDNGCILVAEGANMPTTIEGIRVFEEAKIMYAPGKASNAGGVATSGLEMAQNSLRLTWTREEVDNRLQQIMRNIHEQCVEYGRKSPDYICYNTGANIAGFVKVAEAMIAQGSL